MRVAAGVLLLLLTGWMAGCATYEYDLTEPPELARHVGEEDVSISVEPLQYKLRSYQNRLVMRIYNPTEDRVTLLGADSSVVDPDGQSHPLQTQTIAPGSFIKLIFPPLRPRLERLGPSIGFGVGVQASNSDRLRNTLPYHPAYDEPRYFIYYDGNDPLYWEWDGETTIRVNLAYAREEQFLLHEFVFRRRKM